MDLKEYRQESETERKKCKCAIGPWQPGIHFQINKGENVACLFTYLFMYLFIYLPVNNVEIRTFRNNYLYYHSYRLYLASVRLCYSGHITSLLNVI